MCIQRLRVFEDLANSKKHKLSQGIRNEPLQTNTITYLYVCVLQFVYWMCLLHFDVLHVCIC